MSSAETETTEETTDDRITGANVLIAKSPRIISREKITPAMGALKAAAIPAAAPQPTKVRSRLAETRKN